MGIIASKVDTSRYFPDPKVAAFVADIQDGNLKRVTEALRSGMNPNAMGKEDFRPLFFVFAARHADVMRALLAAGADPNARLKDSNTPLYFAVRLENTQFTKALLDAKADPDALVENDKPIIHEAVRSRQPEQIKLLAAAGADINAVWGPGTPLYGAISAGSWDMARTLLESGADPGWRSPGGRTRYTAGESLCNLFTRPNSPLRATSEYFNSLSALFAAFAHRGVVLPCANQLESFRAR
jgi:ankyrin repeat protein